MATGEQYVRLAINFALIVSVSRLLTPTEIGVSVIGVGIITIVLGLREFATADFLIRRKEIRREDLRTSFTVLFLLTALLCSVVFALAPWFGSLYGEEQLAQFLRIATFAGLIEALSAPITGLLRRDMAFGKLAFINTTSVAVNAATTVLLALAGFSYMSFAFAMVAASSTITLLSFHFRPDLSILWPEFKSWRSVLTFGGYNGVSHVINRIYESLPQLVLGQFLPHSAVGLYNRANVVSDIPDRVILTGVSLVAFPAFSVQVRQGNGLKKPLLQAFAYITVLYWPAQILLVLLAHPIVSLVLGQQWVSVVPLLQVMAIASLAWFPVLLASPVLLAVGAIRDRMLADLTGRSVSAVILCSAAGFGIMAMAASKLLTVPFQMMVALAFLRRHVAFGWGQLGAALWKSAVVTFISATGPVCILVLSEFDFDLSIAASVATLFLALAGWVFGVVVTRHPILLEIGKAAETVLNLRLPNLMRDGSAAHSQRPGEAE